MMNVPRRWLIWVLPLLMLALALLLGTLADAWLESSGGRHLLQRELSKSLGLPVRLDGNYSLKLFPRLRIAGYGLEIGQTDRQGVLASGKEYSAVIELAPFFHHKIQITSIGLRGGFLDFSRAPMEAADEKAQINAEMTLPEVASLEIDDFYIHLAQAGSSLLIRKLQLTGFQPGRPAQLDIDAGWISGQAETARMSLHGGLTVTAGSFSSQLHIRELMLNWGESTIAGLSGDWKWDQPAARLEGQMAWDQPLKAANLQLELVLNPPPSGTLHVRYHQPGLPEPSSLAIDFSVLPEGVGLQRVDMEIAGQSLSGGGCILLTEPAGLHLSLQAGEADLEKIYSILPTPRNDSSEFPFELAVQLHAEKASLAGAEASDMNLAIGPEPDCSKIPGPN